MRLEACGFIRCCSGGHGGLPLTKTPAPITSLAVFATPLKIKMPLGLIFLAHKQPLQGSPVAGCVYRDETIAQKKLAQVSVCGDCGFGASSAYYTAAAAADEIYADKASLRVLSVKGFRLWFYGRDGTRLGIVVASTPQASTRALDPFMPETRR